MEKELPCRMGNRDARAGSPLVLFNAVYEFQKQNISNQHLPLAHDIVPSFEFILTDQDEYKNAIEKV